MSAPTLPKRVFRLPDKVRTHPIISAANNDAARFIVKAAARRSYKTEIAKRKVVFGNSKHAGALTVPNEMFFYCAPTYKQCKRIAWRDLKDMSRPFWSQRPSESDLTIFFRTGSTLTLLGMDNPERLEGSLWYGGIFDEFADCPDTVLEHWQPTTNDNPRSWAEFIGVPEGMNHFYDLFRDAEKPHNTNWAAYTWTCEGILTEEQIAEARRVLDERTYRKEYLAVFENALGLTYYAFTKDNIAARPIDTARTLYMCWDFNAGEKPMAVVLVQETDAGTLHVCKEFVHDYTNTETMCTVVGDWLRSVGFDGELIVTGDYAGRRRESSASLSDYEIIASAFRHYRNYRVVNRPTLSVRDRVASLNALFCNAEGKRRMTVDPSCTALMEDLERVTWLSNGVKLDDRDPNRTHVTDALSYYAYNFHSIESISATRVQ